MTVRDHIRALLSDGQWHNVQEIFRVAWAAVPPEQAVKRWHRKRKSTSLTDLGAQIAWGRRNFILGTIYDMRSDEHIEAVGYAEALRCRQGPRWGKPGRRVALDKRRQRGIEAAKPEPAPSEPAS